MPAMRTFASDNFSSVHPRILRAIASLSRAGHRPSYGSDDVTTSAVAQFRRVLGTDVSVVFTSSGTGANILGLSLLKAKPYDAVISAESAHVFQDEAGAVAGIGMQMLPIPHHHGKIAP